MKDLAGAVLLGELMAAQDIVKQYALAIVLYGCVLSTVHVDACAARWKKAGLLQGVSYGGIVQELKKAMATRCCAG